MSKFQATNELLYKLLNFIFFKYNFLSIFSNIDTEHYSEQLIGFYSRNSVRFQYILQTNNF